MTCHGLPCSPLLPFWEAVAGAFIYGLEAGAYLALTALGLLLFLKAALAMLRLVWR